MFAVAGANGVQTVHAQDAENYELDPIVVEAAPETRQAETASRAVNQAPVARQSTAPATPQDALPAVASPLEGAGGSTRNTYQPEDMYAATKTETPIAETPQSVSVVTRKQMDDQNYATVGGALGYTAGVLSTFEQNTRYDNVLIRGFGGFSTAGSYVQFMDGLKLPQGQVFGIMSVDPFLLDRIDVLKGPSAVLYGQVSPGGMVDMVSRAPSATPYNEMRLEAGSHGRVQAGYTSQGKLNRDGTLQYSLTAIGRDSGTRYNNVDEERFAVAPAVAWQPNADTRITLMGFYQEDPEGGYFNSIYPKSLSPKQYRRYLNSELNVGDPSFDHFHRKEGGIGYQLEHRFNSAVMLNSSLRYAKVDLDMAGLQMSGPMTATGILPRQAARTTEDAWNVASDNHLQFDFATGAFQHRVLTGLDIQSSDSDAEFSVNFFAPTLNVTHPVYGQPVTDTFFPLIDSKQRLEQTGTYLQDQIAIGNWRSVFGIRRDWTEQVTKPDGGLRQSQDADETTYRAGLLYMFDNGLAPYASYSTSFEPVIGVGLGGVPFVPTTGEQYEVGVKYQPSFLPGALLTFSAFDITQQNVLVPGPIVGINIQQGEIRSRGLEFEARGNVTEQLELIGALTLLDMEVTESTDPAAIGKRPQAVPDYFGSVWANYAFDQGIVDGVTLGGGIRFVGSSFGDDANTLEVSGYTLVDMAVSYNLGKITPKLERTDLTFNVWNLFDKEYYSSCSYSIYCEYGDRRTFLAGIRHRW
ncbi:TonB-dependent siderophore receptor [Methyloligella sp. GL2]|nr:TonB-dependent siderophore receptor [Methyloligella sp. GL2]